jgi:2-keto-3-deoxy-L-rhamnonate aldolase RhmA
LRRAHRSTDRRDALDEIVSVPGLDGTHVAPNDLALGCGYGRADGTGRR